MSDSDDQVQRLLESSALREPLLRSVVQALRLPAGSRGLDAGCGVGLQSVLLAEAIGAEGRVTGLDLSPACLRYAQQHVNSLGLAERISFQTGDVRALPFDDHAFDWAWSADCVGYPAEGLSPAVRDLVRVTKPGGSVALLGWSSQQLLPGYPLLEARLNAACSSYAPYFEGTSPQAFFARGLGWCRDAGLVRVTARTFLGEVQAPLSSEVRRALVSLFEMLWVQAPGISPQDRAAYQRLCRPDSADFILDLPDYYGFFTYTLFLGRLPG